MTFLVPPGFYGSHPGSTRVPPGFHPVTTGVPPGFHPAVRAMDWPLPGRVWEIFGRGPLSVTESFYRKRRTGRHKDVPRGTPTRLTARSGSADSTALLWSAKTSVVAVFNYDYSKDAMTRSS